MVAVSECGPSANGADGVQVAPVASKVQLAASDEAPSSSASVAVSTPVPASLAERRSDGRLVRTIEPPTGSANDSAGGWVSTVKCTTAGSEVTPAPFWIVA